MPLNYQMQFFKLRIPAIRRRAHYNILSLNNYQISQGQYKDSRDCYYFIQGKIEEILGRF